MSDEIGFGERFDEAFQRAQITVAKRAELYALLASFINDGVSVHKAFSSIDEQFVTVNDPRRIVTTRVLARLRGDEGKMSLSVGQALVGLVPDTEAVTIEAGEAGGQLAQGFQQAAEHAQNQARIVSLIRGAMVYPVVLFLMMGALLWILKDRMVPSMKRVSKYENWTPSAKLLAWVADNAVILYGSIAAAILLWCLIFMATKGRWIGPARDFFDRYVFPWNMHRRVNASSLLSSLAAMMGMGVPLKTAMDRIRKAASPWVIDHFDRINMRLREGQKDGEAIAKDMFDQSEQWQIVLYGGLMNFSLAMEKLSGKMMERVIAYVQRKFDLIRNIMMFGVGGMIIWVYGTFMSVVMTARQAAGG